MTESGKLRRALIVAAVLLAAGPAAIAASFPDKPIKLVVPYAAGGTIDVIGRILAPKLNALLGQPVIVENKPGAGTMIGASAVARARPDGYTLFVGTNSAFTISPQIMPKSLTYDPLHDFAAIGTVVSFPNLILVRPQSPYKTLADVIQAARANPGKLSYASFGTGTTAELSGEAIKIASGANITAIPYKNGTQCVQAILSGEVSFGFDTAMGSVQRVKAGQLRALAVTSPNRLSSLPDVPSIAEAGFPQSYVVGWTALFVPAATPAATREKLETAFQQLMQDPDVRRQLTGLSAELPALGGAATMQMVRDEYGQLGKLIEKAGIHTE